MSFIFSQQTLSKYGLSSNKKDFPTYKGNHESTPKMYCSGPHNMTFEFIFTFNGDFYQLIPYEYCKWEDLIIFFDWQLCRMHSGINVMPITYSHHLFQLIGVCRLPIKYHFI